MTHPAEPDFEAFHFGPAPARLYGVLRRPAERPTDRLASVLCYPYGREYVRTHWIYVQLGCLLAEAGVPALQFDCRGCGDSFGESTECSFDGWLEDVEHAVETVRLRTGCDRVTLIGLRLGATLAALAGACMRTVPSMVLWNPIVDGPAYWREMIGEHNAWLRGSFAEPRARADSTAHEILGFPYSKLLEANIRGVNLLDLRQAPAASVLLIDDDGEPFRALQIHLSGIGSKVDRHTTRLAPVWMKEDGGADQGFQTLGTLKRCVEWLSHAHP